MLTKPLLALSISAALSTAAFAQDFRQHDAHQHGHVELNIAQDGQDLLMEVTAPGADVVGFEHAPQTEQETQTLNHALATLKQANRLFTLTTQANCRLAEVHVTHSLAGHEEHHEDHDHDQQHGGLTAQYHYHCENISALRHIDNHWFNLFPNTDKISVNLLTERTQTALTLTPKQTQISL